MMTLAFFRLLAIAFRLKTCEFRRYRDGLELDRAGGRIWRHAFLRLRTSVTQALAWRVFIVCVGVITLRLAQGRR